MHGFSHVCLLLVSGRSRNKPRPSASKTLLSEKQPMAVVCHCSLSWFFWPFFSSSPHETLCVSCAIIHLRHGVQVHIPGNQCGSRRDLGKVRRWGGPQTTDRIRDSPYIRPNLRLRFSSISSQLFQIFSHMMHMHPAHHPNRLDTSRSIFP